MKTKTMVLALIIASFLTSCDITGSDFGMKDGQITDEIVFTAEVNKEYLINEELSFKINSVDDSRCPRGVRCVWAGEVKVAVTIDYGVVADTSLSTVLNNELSLGGYDFKIVEVDPYPISEEIISLEDYRIDVKIKKVYVQH